jgi:hypothetical protein
MGSVYGSLSTASPRTGAARGTANEQPMRSLRRYLERRRVERLMVALATVARQAD